jgi:hypothetical protein
MHNFLCQMDCGIRLPQKSSINAQNRPRMSDRMSSVEIEDVLSSIRRLVTDDLRPKPAEPVVAAGEKLLLTPALRVVVPVPDAPFISVPDDDVMRTHDRVATIGAAVPQEGYELETGDESLIAADVPTWPASAWVAPEVMAAVEPAEVAEVAGDWAAEAVPEAGMVHLDDDDAPTPDEEAAMAAWADKAEADVMARLEADEQAAAGGATTFDETVLRDVVRDLIREELQGALGERITRNVRKLVRAELNRALAVHDLE